MSEKVCAVVVTHNRKELLRECLLALSSQTRAPDHILVVDNASTDGTYEMLKMKFPEVEVLRLPENQGGAGGFHEGMKLAYEKGFDWLWLMDDDAEPMPETLAGLLKEALNNDAGVICPIIVTKDGIVQNYHHKLINKRTCTEKPAISERTIKEKRRTSIRALQIDANAFVGPLVKKDVIGKVGLPLKEAFIWGDDTEFTYRCRVNGINLVLSLDSMIYHKDKNQTTDKSLPKSQYWKVFHLAKNRIFFAKKYCGPYAVVYWFLRLFLAPLKQGNIRLLLVHMRGALYGLFRMQ